MSGDSVATNNGVFGIQGAPSVDNTPPGLYQACGVADKQNNFWLFGGANFNNNGEAKTYDALWKYNVTTNEWTWMKGYSSPSHFGSYGIQGVADSNTTPGTRYGATLWVDSSNSIWLFGGIGFASGNAFIGYGFLNDLWKYNITTNEWTWVKGSDDAAAGFNIPAYGIKGVADSSNTPNGRWQCDSWIDQENNLWLFGGYNSETAETGYYNDLWKYNITTNEWTWMKGDSLPGKLGSFGTLGIADSNNNPSARTCQAHWVDSSGNFWMFGGYSNTTNFDLWKFDPVTNNWVCWGSYYLGTASNNGILCTDSAVNWPTSRSETNFSWNDAGNHLWLFGGFGFSLMINNFNAHDDLWKYDLLSKEWVRVFGKDYYTGGYYGQQGVSLSFNYPFARYGGISFQDTSGNFWLFGGIYSLHPNSQTDCFNDLWRYVPDSTCGVYTQVNEIALSENQIEIYPNPVSDVLHVKLSFPQKTTIIIFNHLGKVVIRRNLEDTHEVDVSFLPQGMYLITVCTDGNCYSRKLVIIK